LELVQLSFFPENFGYIPVAGAAPKAEGWEGCPKALVVPGAAPKAPGVEVAPNPITL
jgi:hypothetical protein